MSSSPLTGSPLRQAMITEMTLRRYSPKTIKAYVGAVSLLARHYNRSPSLLSDAEVLDWLKLRLEEGKAASTVHQAQFAVCFLFGEVLKRPTDGIRLPRLRREQKLPQVLSLPEVEKLLISHPKQKYRAAFCLLYGCGLRVGELVALQTSHIERSGMRVRVEQGKGNKDRYTILPARALRELEAYWRETRPPGPWLFPGKDGGHLCTEAVMRAYHEAKLRAGITKRGGVHALRHSFATHHLMGGTDIVTLQRMMGHKHLRTTARYLQIVIEPGGLLPNPLDSLFDDEAP